MILEDAQQIADGIIQGYIGPQFGTSPPPHTLQLTAHPRNKARRARINPGISLPHNKWPLPIDWSVVI